MSVLTVNPFEGVGINYGYSSGHQGQDFQTPRIYDYTAPSDGVVEYVGGTYHSIIVRRADGSKWRMAEVAVILVAVGQPVKLGQVIGRNSYYRGGIYRSPHMNAGGDTGRSPFTGIVTATKAQAAAIIAANEGASAKQRTVKRTGDSVRRMGPGTRYNVAGEDLKAGAVGNFIAFAHGPTSQGQPAGNDVWYQGISGHWFWSGAFTVVSGSGLLDKTAEFADIVVTLPPVIEVPVPPEDLPEPIEPPEVTDPWPTLPEPGSPEEPLEPSVPEEPVVVPPVVVVPPIEPDPDVPDEELPVKPPSTIGIIVAAVLAVIAIIVAVISGNN